MKYLTDGQGSLVCYPYSISNLHEMASELGINRKFFWKNHYSIPHDRKDEIEGICELITTKDMIKVINGKSYANSRSELQSSADR